MAMTTKDLIQLLAQYPPDLRVVVNGYEEGYDDLSPKQVSSVKIALNTGKHRWEGKHGDPDGRTDADDIVEALVLRRVSN